MLAEQLSATVSVVATDSCGNTSDPVVFNTRIDDTKPVISGVPADVTVSCGEEPAAPTVTATDTCSGTLTVYLKETRENINGCTNTLTRCWTATDSCGNTDTKCQVITIADLNPPVLTNPDGVSACTGSTVSVNPPTATDDCDGNVEINVSDNGTWKTKSTDGGATYTPSWASVVSAIVAAGGSHTIHVVASDNCGHEASGDFSISLAACDEHCTLTQGFYGNQKGKFNGVSGFTVVNTLLTAPYGGDLIVGAGGATLKITSGQGGCIAMWLPAGGPSVAMPPGAHVFGSGCSTDLPTQKNGKAFRNNLLGQVITLALNLRLDVYAGNTPGLGSWPLPAEFCTGNGEVVTGHYTIPASILAALPANPTVQDLLNLANAVLGGVNTTIDPSAIGGAVTTINEAFDECKFTMPCILD